MKKWAWSDHVSEHGLFIGFIGAVNMLNIETQIRDHRDDLSLSSINLRLPFVVPSNPER